MKAVTRSSQENLAWAHRRLVDFAGRVEQGTACPAELTHILHKGHYATLGVLWFSRMASLAVQRKYALAGHRGMVALLDEALAWLNERLAHPMICGPRSPGERLYLNSVRISVHARRCRFEDADLFVVGGFSYDFTAWLFQGADLRYRRHGQTLPRLGFLIACFAHYAEHGLTPETAHFGLDAFPLTGDLEEDVA